MDSENKALAETGSGRIEGVEEFRSLLVGAQQGDQKALARLKAQFGDHPAFWTRFGGDVARRAEDALADRMAGDALLTREAVRVQMAQMRAQLAGPISTPLEQLLIDRVVLCAFQLLHAETSYAERLEEGMSEQEVRYFERRVDGMNKRYLAAVRALATVRKLQLPTVQVNVAEKQINIAQG